MGFLDDYDIDLDDFNETGGFDVPDGTYNFTVVRGELKEGTTKDPEARNIVIYFNLENGEGETFTWNWWLTVPADPERPTKREAISMTDWKKWLLGAGFEPKDISSVGPEDIADLTGILRLVTGKPNHEGKTYQNARDWAFDDAEEEEAPEPPKKAARPAAAKKAKPAPEPEPEDDEEEEEEEAPKPRTRKAGNPFQKK